MKDGNKGKFTVKDGKMLFLRYGPANAQKQVHREGNVAPTGRGIWVFPYPYGDLFFVSHIIQQRMPKRLKDSSKWPADKVKEYCAEYDAKWKEIHKTIEKPKKLWWSGEIYSRIASDTQKYESRWYYYPNPHEFCISLRKHVVNWIPNFFGMGKAYKLNVSGSSNLSRDHLECFLPM